MTRQILPMHIKFNLSVRVVFVVVLLAILSVSVFQVARGLRRQHTPTLADADSKYSKQSYAKALTEYEALLKEGKVPSDRTDEVGKRIVICLGKTQQWDRAMAEGLAYVQAHRGTRWEPEGVYVLAGLYETVNHQGWRVNGKIYRGQNPPKTDAAASPEFVDFSESDQRNRLDALEATVTLFARFPIVNPRSTAEIGFRAHIERELIAALEASGSSFRWFRGSGMSEGLEGWANKRNWLPPTDPGWKIDPTATYDPLWPIPKKLLFLFRHIGQSYNQQAQALMEEAAWLRTYHATMAGAAVRMEGGKPVRIPYPYQSEKPEARLAEIVRRFPGSVQAQEAAYVAANWKVQDGDLKAGLAAYQGVIDRYPGSPVAKSAASEIRAIRRPTVAIIGAEGMRPGNGGKLVVSVRNTRSVRLEAFRVDLVGILGTSEPFHKVKQKADEDGGVLTAQLLNRNQLRKLLASGHVSRLKIWELSVPDHGDLTTHQEKLSLPFTQAGNVVVVASTDGNSDRHSIVVPYTDLAVVRKHANGTSMFYVADARSGRPVVGAHVLVRRWWRKEQQYEYTAVTVERGTTNRDGFISLSVRPWRGNTLYLEQTVAWVGSDCAVTDVDYYNEYGGEEQGSYLRAYGTTDRAVYRPQQVVQFRELLVRRVGNEKGTGGAVRAGGAKKRYLPVTRRAVRVAVQGPQGNVVYKQRTLCDAFGTVSGKFQLPADTPLGEYRLTVSIPGKDGDNPDPEDVNLQEAGNQFRVEEYKKPEYLVSVTAASERVKLGKPTHMKVHAEYYFGGPVPGAKVTYRVYRNYFAQSYRFPRPYDYLYDSSNQGDMSAVYKNGPVVAQGKATLDAQGDADIHFDTDQATPGDTNDQSYTVEADVQDSSRRVITGTGEVKATKHDVAVFLDFPHGYATAGDRIDVEVKTLNPSDRPVSVPGMARVYRHATVPGRKDTLVFETPMTTDKEGYAQIRWQNREAGYYRVAFETKDSEGLAVEADQDVWVDGAALRSQRFLFQGVHLAVKNPYQVEGQTAKVLLVTPEPGCTVLLTREVDGEVRDRRLVQVSGRSLEIPVAISGADVPNVFLSAVMVRNRAVYEATQELFVPPARQTLQVTVTPDKARYAPGEKAHFRLVVRDYAGRPVHTTLSVAITDAALAYIQKDYAPDIRTYFYGDRRAQNTSMQSSLLTAFWQFDKTAQLDQARTYQMQVSLAEMRMRTLARMAFTQDYDEAAPKSEASALMSGDAMNGSPPANRGRARFLAAAAVADGSVLIAQSASPELRQFRPSGGLKIPVSAPATVSHGSELASASIRQEFRDTAFWTPAVITDANGNASVDFLWPDNLTRWRAHVVASSQTAQVGMAEAKVTTKKDLLVQLEAPRFAVERDVLTLSAIVHNDTNHAAHIRVKLDLDNADVVAEDVAGGPGGWSKIHTRFTGICQNPMPNVQNPQHLRVKTSETWIDLPKGAQQRVDWLVRPQHEGEMHIRMAAQSATEGDATQTILPVLVHGVERTVVQSGKIEGGSNTVLPEKVNISLPELRKPGSSQVVVTLSPSLASVLLDALPYLADYPYGCVEQTMSRFLPSVIVANTLKSTGYDLKALEKAAERNRQNAVLANGIDKVANSSYTYPGGLKSGQKNAFPGGPPPSRLSRPNPVLNATELQRMVKEGLTRLRDFQHADGGWGWWKEGDSDPYMTSYVLDGLIQCDQYKVNFNDDAVNRAVPYLLAQYKEEKDLHRLAYEARVLAKVPAVKAAILDRIEKRLYVDRAKLTSYSKALLAMTLWDIGQKQQSGVVLENIENTVHIDEAHGTANWDDGNNGSWYWYNNRVEMNATILQAYTAINPTSRLAPMLAKWLVDNRQGTTWQDTHDTALAVNALADWMRANKELAPDYTLTLDLGNRIKRTYRVTPETALFFDNTFVVPDSLLTTGDQTLTITKEGTGTCYYTAVTRTFSQEEPITATGNQIEVRRRYFRLTPEEIKPRPTNTPDTPNAQIRPNPFLTGRYELLNADEEGDTVVPMQPGQKYIRTEIKDGDFVSSGDLIEVELLLESANDYEYVLVEDMKPAGCEAVELRSGGDYSPGLYANREMRDTKVAFFLDHLPQGRRLLNYRLRAEVPGLFHALPTNLSAMYAPNVRALSDETRMGIRDMEATGVANH